MPSQNCVSGSLEVGQANATDKIEKLERNGRDEYITSTDANLGGGLNYASKAQHVHNDNNKSQICFCLSLALYKHYSFLLQRYVLKGKDMSDVLQELLTPSFTALPK